MEAFPSRVFVVSPVWGFHCMEGVFYRDGTLSSDGDFSCIPGYFGSAVEGPTLCAQVSYSSLACRVFFFFFGGGVVGVLACLFFPFNIVVLPTKTN